jgi:hypothetical protein
VIPQNGDLSKFNPSNPLAQRTWSKADISGTKTLMDQSTLTI